MRKTIELVLTPNEANSEQTIEKAIRLKGEISNSDSVKFRILKKSIDARKSLIKINLSLDVFINEQPSVTVEKINYQYVENRPPVIIVGAGPAGLFAALQLLEDGYKPIVLERGKNVSDRKRDIALIHREGIVNSDSNYGFGEGGAGTFSDGKLYTRSKKRGSTEKILQVLFNHGARENILYEAHPHIGTDKLPKIISNIRETIINNGGEVHFNTRVTEFIIKDGAIKGVVDQNGNRFESKVVILATGHSSRDIYKTLHQNGILLEAKSFAMGVRIEHPQDLIDQIQYHGKRRDYDLPSASYSLVNQVEDRGVYSFCMCPGGFIVPAATGPQELVVNGMSPSERNSPYANSGLVVEIRLEDIPGINKNPILAGLEYQMELERLAFEFANKSQQAPAQRIADFVSGKHSHSLPKTSYVPGLLSSDLHKWMPQFIAKRLREAIKIFDKRIHGYLSNEGIVVGVESRTSSPIRIPRNSDTFMHPEVTGLFPSGEGAGYAGGIASSAIDGENCAKKAVEFMRNSK